MPAPHLDRLLASTVRRLARSIPKVPPLAVVLGSGFGSIGRAIDVKKSWRYEDLPGLPVGSVPGHQCELIWGGLGDVEVLVLSGRAHYYEGLDLTEVTLPIRVLHRLGVRAVLLTNAAGGIRRGLRPGHFMAISDHINMIGANPLRGARACFGRGHSTFVDMTEAYDPALRRLLRVAGRTAGISVSEGVYLGVSGPSYETPAEIRAFAALGADAVGMSTVAETIVARHCGLRVVGLSGITNLAAGLGQKGSRLSHDEVLAQATSREDAARRLVTDFVQKSARLL